MPQCEMERILRNEGLCIIDARAVYTSVSPNTESETLHFTKDGVGYQRTEIKTPQGELSSMARRVAPEKTESTSWRIEMTFKIPADYDAIEFMV